MFYNIKKNPGAEAFLESPEETAEKIKSIDRNRESHTNFSGSSALQVLTSHPEMIPGHALPKKSGNSSFISRSSDALNFSKDTHAYGSPYLSDETRIVFSAAFNRWIKNDGVEVTEELLVFYKKIMKEGVSSHILSSKESDLIQKIMLSHSSLDKNYQTEKEFQNRVASESSLTGKHFFTVSLNAMLREEQREMTQDEYLLYEKVKHGNDLLNNQELDMYRKITLRYVQKEARRNVFSKNKNSI